jgi:Cu2+-exporting ATPase
LGRIEFELDTNNLTLEEVIKQLNAKTGYTFEKHFPPTGQILELLTTNLVTLSNAARPPGVTRFDVSERCSWRASRSLSGRPSTIPAVDGHIDLKNEELIVDTVFSRLRSSPSTISKQLIRIHYDATQIGARDLFEHYRRYDHELQLAPPAAHPSLAVGRRQMYHALKHFLPALVCTLPVVILAWTPIDHSKLAYAHISLIFATTVQGIAIKEFVPGALRSLWHSHIFDMDFLIAVSSSIAYVFSVVSYGFQIKGKPLETGSFFETSTLLVTLILLGRVSSCMKSCNAS